LFIYVRSDDEERKIGLTGFGGSDKFFSVVYGLKKKESTDQLQRKMRAQMAWRNAFNKVRIYCIYLLVVQMITIINLIYIYM